MKKDFLKYLNIFYNEFHLPVEVFNQSGDLVFINNAFTSVWDYSLKEISNYNIFNDVYVKASVIQPVIKKAFEDKTATEVYSYSDTLMKSKKVTLPVYKTKIIPIQFEANFYFIFIHEDQTEIFLAEAELKKAREASKEADRLKNTFLNVLSHELRTPLNIILGYSTIIKESLKDKVSTEEKIYLDNLYNGSERLFKSISQMLEFAQLEAGNFKFTIETVDLIPMIQYSIQTIKQLALEKKIDLKTNIKDQSILVDIDAHCVGSAVNNLINNAIKFTEKGFIEIETGIMKDQDLAFLKVRDSGVGISADYLDHLYLPFSQEDLNLSRNYEGNGLGLAITKRYIEKLGGSLLVDSIKGVGTTFTITLPLSQKAQKSKVDNQAADNVSLKKILMLDEFHETSKLVKIFLKETAELFVHVYENFANHLYKNDEYKLVILDLNLSQWNDGLGLC
ncbi:MAG: HAMP domain-containing histidine kinase, partial [Ignavibacteriaceae bacterium]|nr:HAMP domain-containing histidine kinase [Ignavibacteriaceae bacterium]